VAHYKFESEWELEAPIDRVFELLTHPEDFQRWWPSVTDSRRIEEGDDDGVGAVAAYTLQSPVFYSMDFQAKALEVDRPRRIHTLVRGDLIGTGTYLLEQQQSRTKVVFLWYVATTRRWMNLVAPVARPLFVWAHHHVMREGATAMAAQLGGRLIGIKTRTVDRTPQDKAAPSLAEGDQQIASGS
jgi:carbon monoxide dehydrogenase subunit G